MKGIKSLVLLFALYTATTNAQTFKFGTIAADIGPGIGIFGIKGYSPVNGSNVSGIGFVGTLPRVNAEFGIFRFLGVGVSYRRGTYGKTSAGPLRGNDFLVRANIHVANENEKFDLPIGVGFGFSNFKGDYTTTQYIYAKGPLLNIHVSPHFYFGKYVGMHLSVGYNKHMNNKVDINDNGTHYSEADGATWKMGGVYFEFGVSGKFDLFNKD